MTAVSCPTRASASKLPSIRDDNHLAGSQSAEPLSSRFHREYVRSPPTVLNAEDVVEGDLRDGVSCGVGLFINRIVHARSSFKPITLQSYAE